MGNVQPRAEGPPLFSARPTTSGSRESDPIYRTLRQSIVGGQIPAWTRLVEEDLAEEFQVSRSPIREALRHLEYDGLVQRLRRGMLVAVPFEPSERADIHLIRIEMDRLAARLATERATPDDWGIARGAVEQMRVAIEGGASPSAVALAHLEVHAAINRVAFGGRLASLMTHSVGIYSGLADVDYVQQPGHDPVKQHYDLIDDLASGDLQRALAAVDNHAVRSSDPA